ncbi:MAG: ATP phosphoribosyltransferase regulatory subunit [Sarcina sp.]
MEELPKGTRDLINEESRQIAYTIKTINEYFDDIGYEEVITPSFEFYNIFNQTIKDELMYKFYDQEGRLLTLKADSTLPIARVVSTRFKDRNFPLRIRYSSKVFKANKNLAGNKNEEFDAGIEIIGENTLNSDIEALIIAIDCLLNLGFEDFTIEIGHVGIVKKLIEKLNINIENQKHLITLIEDKRLVDLNEFLKELNVKPTLRDVLNKLPWMFGDIENLNVEKNIIYDSEILECVKELEFIYAKLNKIGFSKYISFDLGAATKINYYSGIVFKGYINGAANYILKGGRYDNLMSFYGKNIGAIGFSLKIDEIAKLIDKKFISTDNVQVYNYDDSNHLNILLEVINNKKNNRKSKMFKKE